MRSTAARARTATVGSTVTSSLRNSERLENFRQRDALHMRAEIARPHELDVGGSTATLSLIEHSVTSSTFDGWLSCTHLIMPLVEPVKSASASTSGAHSGWAMIFTPGSALAIGTKLLAGEPLMHLAMALPGDDLDVGLGLHPFGEILVGDHDHARLPERLDHPHGVGRGAADVGLGLHFGRGVDVGHHRHAGIGFAQRAHIGAGDRRRERAAGSWNRGSAPSCRD